jgi:hypothetical protein
MIVKMILYALTRREEAREEGREAGREEAVRNLLKHGMNNPKGFPVLLKPGPKNRMIDDKGGAGKP